MGVDEDRGRVGADRHEGAVAQGDLPAVADQQVQTHDHDCEDQHLGPLEALEARDLRGQAGEHDHTKRYEPVAARSLAQKLQARLTARRPSRPLGLITRTAMMIANATARWRPPPTAP